MIFKKPLNTRQLQIQMLRSLKTVRHRSWVAIWVVKMIGEIGIFVYTEDKYSLTERRKRQTDLLSALTKVVSRFQ